MIETLQSFAPSIPWLVNLIQFGIMAGLIWRIVGVLDHALARAQVATATPTAPAPVPVAPAPKPALPTVVPTEVVVDQGLINYIKKAEGFQSKAYWDYKQYSIGYGTKATSAAEIIDQAEAERRLIVEIDKAWNEIKDFIPADAPKGVKQALLDLTYNAGAGWEHGSLGTAVRAGKWDTAKADILLYNHAGGVVNAGLTARRQTEVSWFDNPL